MELFLRIAGTVVGVLGGFLTALWEIFLSPPHAFVIPLAPLLAIASNVALVWFTKRVTGRNGLALLPGVVWFIAMFVGAMRTTEGDVLIPGNDWPGLLAILLGALGWGVAAYRMVLNRTEPVAPAPPPTRSRIPAKRSR